MSTNRKSDKEIAFLQDLFIAPDWGERFAELIDEHVKLPAEGEALYVGASTGGHATLFRGGDKSVGVFHPLKPAVAKIHRRLKSAFDPAGILNPGRMYDF